MKSLKSLLALTAIVTLSFGCAAVTDASLINDPADRVNIEAQANEAGIFNTGNGVKPIVDRPEI